MSTVFYQQPKAFLQRPAAEAVSKAVERMTSMSRLAILFGGDVIASGATEPLLQLVERLRAPVIETRLGKGALSAEHPLWLGHCREPHVRELLKETDGLLAVGVRFTQIDTSGWQAEYPRAIVQIDRDEHEIGREISVEVGVAGDLKPSLEALLEELNRRVRVPRQSKTRGRHYSPRREAKPSLHVH
ncbi:MAG: hypothetical protein IH908_13420 [Proteobacteria bacterium]|nr:hypothetical protein [Pseudomonadota bacterium]